MEQLNALLPYAIGVNIVTFILMGADKRKAIKHAWRVPERTFWLLALLGGSIGAFIGMRTFRHKTKHRSFVIGMPLIMAAHFLLIIYLFFEVS